MKRYFLITQILVVWVSAVLWFAFDITEKGHPGIESSFVLVFITGFLIVLIDMFNSKGNGGNRGSGEKRGSGSNSNKYPYRGGINNFKQK